MFPVHLLPYYGRKTFRLYRNGIMERGFDRINRLFVPKEGDRVIGNPNIRWAPESAKLLDRSPWLN